MKSVFLDLDGTLTDPKPGITRSIQYALTGLGREAPSEDDLTWCIGPPLIGSFEKLLGDRALAEKGPALYRERFGDVGLFENKVYDGIPEMLETLRVAGYRLRLATSKPHVFASRIVAHFGLDQWVEQVFGSELDGTRVDKSDLIAFAIAASGVRKEAAVMIGDREHDIIGARANDIPGVGALWGYGVPGELEAAGADFRAADPAEAAAMITAILEHER